MANIDKTYTPKCVNFSVKGGQYNVHGCSTDRCLYSGYRCATAAAAATVTAIAEF